MDTYQSKRHIKDLGQLTHVQHQLLLQRLEQIWLTGSTSEKKNNDVRSVAYDVMNDACNSEWHVYIIGGSSEVPSPSRSTESDSDHLYILQQYIAYTSEADIPTNESSRPLILDSTGLHQGYYVLIIKDDRISKTGVKGKKVGIVSGEGMKQQWAEQMAMHGYNVQYKKGDTAIRGEEGRLEIDNVLGLRCKRWPVEIKHAFESRSRKWPSTSFIKKVVDMELYLVAKDHRNSRRHLGCQWRLSFTFVEQNLFHEMSKRQHIIFYIAKDVFKSCLKMSNEAQQPGNEALGTYIIKTIVLWEYESVDCSWWDSHSLVQCLERVLNSAVRQLRAEMLQQYCIPDNNLLDTVSRKACFDLADKIKAMLEKTIHLPDLNITVLSSITTFMLTQHIGDLFCCLSNANYNQLGEQVLYIGQMSNPVFETHIKQMNIYSKSWMQIIHSFPYVAKVFETALFSDCRQSIVEVMNNFRNRLTKKDIHNESEGLDINMVTGLLCYIFKCATLTDSWKRKMFLMILIKFAAIAKLPFTSLSTQINAIATFRLLQLLFYCKFFDTAKYVSLVVKSYYNVDRMSRVNITLHLRQPYPEYPWMANNAAELPLDIRSHIFYIRCCQKLDDPVAPVCVQDLRNACKLYLDCPFTFQHIKENIQSTLQSYCAADLY